AVRHALVVELKPVSQSGGDRSPDVLEAHVETTGDEGPRLGRQCKGLGAPRADSEPHEPAYLLAVGWLCRQGGPHEAGDRLTHVSRHRQLANVALYADDVGRGDHLLARADRRTRRLVENRLEHRLAGVLDQHIEEEP